MKEEETPTSIAEDIRNEAIFYLVFVKFAALTTG